MNEATTIKVPLSKPIEAHGKTYSELEIREPKGVHIARCGIPFSTDGNINAKAIAQYIEVLGNIPPSSVESLCSADWIASMGAVLSFFTDANLTKPSMPIGS